MERVEPQSCRSDCSRKWIGIGRPQLCQCSGCRSGDQVTHEGCGHRRWRHSAHRRRGISGQAPALRAFIQTLAGTDGYLPVWSKWFDGDRRRASLVGIDILRSDRNALARFESGLPKMHVSWFDETMDLARWDHIPAGFIQASRLYDHAQWKRAAAVGPSSTRKGLTSIRPCAPRKPRMRSLQSRAPLEQALSPGMAGVVAPIQICDSKRQVHAPNGDLVDLRRAPGPKRE
jgi:hypothetical protein